MSYSEKDLDNIAIGSVKGYLDAKSGKPFSSDQYGSWSNDRAWVEGYVRGYNMGKKGNDWK